MGESAKDNDDPSWQGDNEDDHSSVTFDGIDKFSYQEQEGQAQVSWSKLKHAIFSWQ